MLEKNLKDAASSTPDPERALKNLLSFCKENSGYIDQLKINLRPISLLFSISQFLANFASSNPEALFDAITKINTPIDKEAIHALLKKDIDETAHTSREAMMKIIRIFKKRFLLLIAMRDVMEKTDIVEGMYELSLLAEVIAEESLCLVRSEIDEIYGKPEDDAFSVIAVGKLGSEELNFSSDVDLLYVYGKEAAETSGVMTSHGITKNRINNHEYYCKLGENLNRFLTENTGDGFVYRVDLRLRPEGRKGSLALSLPAYEIYYESWGRTWERAVLLRARHLAGDNNLGRDFIEMVKPFVYRKYLDFNAIDEIRKMKTKIDETFKKDDIKRGYGGIREIEFFVHALQLIYGGKEPLLRERSTLKSLHLLLQKNLIGHGDYSTLNDNYRFLRKLEHRLQQLNDLQTHSLPSSENELVSLSKKMNFAGKELFANELDNRRRMVRKIYDSLFSEGKPKTLKEDEGSALFFSEELSDSEFRELLSPYPIKDIEKVVRNIHLIREGTISFQTLRGQRLLSEILPSFLSEALHSGDPDAALNNLQAFTTVLSSEESYLDLFAKNNLLIPSLIRVFSQSDYLAKSIIKRREYLELLAHEMSTGKTLHSLKNELKGVITAWQSVSDAIRTLKQMEEIRLGIMFLDKRIDTVRLIKGLTRTAEAVVSVCTDELAKSRFITIGMGKLGGRELTFESDLDLTFACEGDIQESHVKVAERLIRLLTSYTKEGMAYKVDVRLRPDGSKGPLVSTLNALRNYYTHAAHFWEFQALLKARPVAGDGITACRFMEMREEILKKRGKDVSASGIRAMRERIQRELSREKEGYDIKLGPGGIEELEFTVQYLQLTNGGRHAGLFVQGSLDAIKRLAAAEILDKKEAGLLKETYILYRTLESFMRLGGESIIKKTGLAASRIAGFMGFGNSKELLERVHDRRSFIKKVFEKYLH